MDNSNLAELVGQLENHIECWKQFNCFLKQARAKNFNADDESQFLELKSSLAQELETILTSIETGAPDREGVHELISAAPSLRYLSEQPENYLRGLESRWHKNFVGWQTVLGLVKAQGKNLAVEELINQLENHVEFWKQFSICLNVARTKKFDEEDENQFLEIKSGLVQELQTILGAIESGAPDREDVMELITRASSLRYLGELEENALRGLESKWHKVFLTWQSILGQLKSSRKKLSLDDLILQMENHIECWKQFNHYLVQGRSKQFTDEDETLFLEVKSNLAQELEFILAAIPSGAPERDEIHELVGNAPSIRYLTGQSDNSMRGLENGWHKVFLAWQSILGQLKVQQRSQPKKRGLFSRLFGRK